MTGFVVMWEGESAHEINGPEYRALAVESGEVTDSKERLPIRVSGIIEGRGFDAWVVPDTNLEPTLDIFK